MSEYTNLSFVQGDDKSFAVIIEDNESPAVAIDLTGSVIAADIVTDFGRTPVGSFVIEETDLINGKFNLVLTTATTSQLPQRSKTTKTSFKYDVQITAPSGLKRTEIKGNLVMNHQVTV